MTARACKWLTERMVVMSVYRDRCYKGILRFDNKQGVYEKAFRFTLEDIEKYFGCKAELQEIIPCLSNKEDLEIIRALYIGARRDLVRF